MGRKLETPDVLPTPSRALASFPRQYNSPQRRRVYVIGPSVQERRSEHIRQGRGCVLHTKPHDKLAGAHLNVVGPYDADASCPCALIKTSESLSNCTLAWALRSRIANLGRWIPYVRSQAPRTNCIL
jgi:hypothetical protein